MTADKTEMINALFTTGHHNITRRLARCQQERQQRQPIRGMRHSR
jgi:hypothetical protein